MMRSGNESSVGPPGGRRLADGSYTYTPRNLLASGDGFQYIYDGWNRRTVTIGHRRRNTLFIL